MRIKSIIAGLVVMGAFMTNGMVFAQETNSNPGPDKPLMIQEGSGKNRDLAQEKEMHKQKMDTMNANREKIADLINENKEKVALVKEKITELKSNPKALTEKKIAVIKESLSLLKADMADMAATSAELKKLLEENRQNIENKDFAAVFKNVDKIIAAQEKWIDILHKMNDNIDRLLKTLE